MRIQCYKTALLTALLMQATACMNIRSINLSVGTSTSSSSNTSAPVIEKGCATTLMNGAGTVEDPYQVCNKDHLASLANATSGTEFALVSNIDLLNVPFEPIMGFRGNLDGRNFKISNLRFMVQTSNFVGLFSTINGNVTIKNLKIENALIEGKDFVGVLAGRLNGSSSFSRATLSNISIINPVVFGNNNVSNLVGSITNSNLSSIVVNNAALVGVSKVGMLAGYSPGAMLVDTAQLDGVVSGSFSVGGAVGAAVGSTIRKLAVYTNLSVDENGAQVLSNSLTQRQIGGLFGSISDSSVLRFYIVGTINSTSSGFVSIVGALAGESSTTAFNEGYTAVRSMKSLGATESFQGAVGAVDGASTFVKVYYFYSPFPMITVPDANNTPSITQVSIVNLQVIHTAVMATFDFVETWKADVTADFKLPVFKSQNMNKPFLESVYNPMPTLGIFLSEVEDSSTYTFPTTAESASPATKTITLTNSNPFTIKLKALRLAGGVSYSIDQPSSSCFGQISDNIVMNAASNCSIVVKFLPRTGVSSGTVVLNDLLLVDYEYYSSVDAKILPAKVGHKLDGLGTYSSPALLNSSHSFGGVSVNSPLDVNKDITNTGTDTLEFVSFEMSNPNYQWILPLGTVGSTLVPGATFSLPMRFEPTSTGTHSASMTIKYRGLVHTDIKTIVINFTGTGI